MKWYVLMILLHVIFCIGSFGDPHFVDAREKCYVDEDANDGDGSSDDPYEDIEKALDEDCSDIVVAKGTYKDDITISKDVSVKCKSRDEVIITGKVTMKDGSTLESCTVSRRGIVVADGADAEIKNVRIKDAHIGIETTGGGKLTVDDCLIHDNDKGLYIQKGKSVKITDTNINDNDEEGLDIRSDVSGTISDNTIEDNGESGIEVILGKADLLISDNKIKENGSSGIATQYYKGTGKSGAVKIKGNTIEKNKKNGIDCNTPSGGNPGKDFWDATLNMSSNTVSGNKDGDFATECSLPEDSTLSATMTKQQKEAYDQKQLELQKAEQLRIQEEKEQELQEKKETEEEARIREEEQARLREQMQRETDAQTTIKATQTEIVDLYKKDIIARGEVMQRPSFVMFFIGPKMKQLDAVKNNIVVYDQKIIVMHNEISKIESENVRSEMNALLVDVKNKREEMQSFVDQYNNEFSLFGWLFNRKK
jgi:nitrous oxidase accessory protein NosD